MQERRRSPRPPLWLNLLLLVIAAGTFAYAKHQRDAIDAKTALLFKRSESSPAEIQQMRDDLAKRDLTREQLAKQLDGRTWTFVPLKGEFNVVGKESDYAWTVPDWLYAMIGKPPAHESVRNGLGRYVVVLRNNYIIHSTPPPESPLQGPKPGSFMVPEADLAAIWPRISTATRVYIF